MSRRAPFNVRRATGGENIGLTEMVMGIRRSSGAAAPAGVTTNLTVALKQTGRKLLAAGAALAALNAAQAGNTFTLTHNGAGVVEPTTGALYTANVVTVGPGGGWTGVKKSGYASWTEDGNARTAAPDVTTTGGLGIETRTTAMPSLQFIGARNCRFTGSLVLSFVSEAKGGVAKVRLYDEGSVNDQAVKSWRYLTDDAGITQAIYGYHFTLDQTLHTAGTNEKRTIQLYARSYPTNGAMQTKLIGTGLNMASSATIHRADPLLLFHPEPTPHDVCIHIDTNLGAAAYYLANGSAATSTTANRPYTNDSTPIAAFPTLDAAINWACNTNTYNNGALRAPKVIFKQSGTYELVNASGATYANYWATQAIANGYATYMTFVPDTGVDVVLSKSTAISDSTTYTNSAWKCWWQAGVELRQTNGATSGTYTGSILAQADNLTDMLVSPQSGTALTNDAPLGVGLWNNCATIGATWAMNGLLDYNNKARNGFVARYSTFAKTRGAGPAYAVMAWGSDFSECWIDLTNYCHAIYNCTFTNCGAEFVNTVRNTLQVKYVGAQASGTANLTAATSTGTWSFADGVNTYTTPAISTFANFSAVVTWINANTAGNWTAQLDPSVSANDRLTDMCPTAYNPPNFAGATVVSNGGPFTNKNVWNVVTTWQDVHVDYCQMGQLSVGANADLSDAVDNIIHQQVKIVNGWRIQTIFLDANVTDSTFEAFSINSKSNPSVGSVAAQIAKKFSHVRFIGYADPNITLQLHNSDVRFSMDTYCEITGCVFASFSWDAAASAPASPQLDKCHFVNPGGAGINATTGVANLNVPTNFSCGTGGSVVTDIYPGMSSYTATDFHPAGALLSNTVAKFNDVDSVGADQPATTVKGGKAATRSSITMTKTQALAVAGVTFRDATGTAVDTATISFSQGAGDTGLTDQVVYSFDLAA